MKNIETDEKSVKRCKKCGDVAGTNVDGKTICGCEVWPRKDEQIHRPHRTN